ncbi:GrxA family glutaredoxin, partial [Escherichia coli]|nr:GrxA family glutaredoxin [Escherichia coli]
SHRALSEHKTLSVSWSHYLQYQYVDIRAEGITKEDLQQKAGKPVETVPQIFVDQQHIGGYTDFAAWVKENLDA